MSNPTYRQRLLRTLALLAVAGSTTFGSIEASLAEVPVREVRDLLTDTDADWADEDRAHLLSLLLHDPRPATRLSVATSLAALPDGSPHVETVLRRLASDPAEPVRRATGHALSAHLGELAVPERTQRLAQWSTAPLVEERVAAARALLAGVSVPAADALLLTLADDSDADVRRQALQAAARHYFADAALSMQLVARGGQDKDPEVRKLAHELDRMHRHATHA